MWIPRRKKPKKNQPKQKKNQPKQILPPRRAQKQSGPKKRPQRKKVPRRNQGKVQKLNPAQPRKKTHEEKKREDRISETNQRTVTVPIVKNAAGVTRLATRNDHVQPGKATVSEMVVMTAIMTAAERIAGMVVAMSAVMSAAMTAVPTVMMISATIAVKVAAMTLRVIATRMIATRMIAKRIVIMIKLIASVKITRIASVKTHVAAVGTSQRRTETLAARVASLVLVKGKVMPGELSEGVGLRARARVMTVGWAKVSGLNGIPAVRGIWTWNMSGPDGIPTGLCGIVTMMIGVLKP